jgi:hypothetical protein
MIGRYFQCQNMFGSPKTLLTDAQNVDNSKGPEDRCYMEKKRFRLKLGPKELTDQELAARIAAKASGEVKKQRKLIKEWITVNSDFDKNKYIQIWEDYRKEYGNKFMEECLRIYAIANAALDVNTMLTVNMGMKDAGIDISYFTATLGKMFTINLTNALIEKVKLSKGAKEELMIRAIAREFPYKENTNKQPSTPLVETPNITINQSRERTRRRY